MRYPHTATYWGSPVPDGYGGYSYASPVTLEVRWEEKTERFIDGDGEETRSLALVYAKQDLDVAGFLYLGTSAAADPRTVEGAMRIRQFGRVTNLRGTRAVRKAWL